MPATIFGPRPGRVFYPNGSKMRVLVTRPEPGATRTAQLLRSRGYDPVLLPLTRTVPIAGSNLSSRHNAAAYAVTSAAALHHWVTLGISADQRAMPLYAVGAATAGVATALGFSDVRIGGGDGESLAALLIDDAAGGRLGLSGDAPLLYVAGRIRRPRFEGLLRRAGLPFSVVEIYDTQSISYSTDFFFSRILVDEPTAVLLYSHNAAEILFDHLIGHLDDKQLENNTFLCISEHVAKAVPSRLADRIRIAVTPNEADLMAELESLYDLS